jgi:pimeloyl-ACP methyl ester carboxylesterase
VGRGDGAGARGAAPRLRRHAENWVATGVVDALLAAGRRVIALDARVHGSEKPHDLARYGEQRMAKDLAVLLDTIGAGQSGVSSKSTARAGSPLAR